MNLFLLSVSIVCAEPPVPVAKTGQTTSYRTGDDGDHEKGVAVPYPRFTDNGDGTVTDNLTGLMWAKNANLDNGTMTWTDAIDYANNLSMGSDGCGSSYADWRLPNVKELESQIDHSYFNPPLPSDYPFLNVQSDLFYWTSTASASNTSIAWNVNMYNGVVNFGTKTNGDYVWPVRSGN